jgi:glucose-6-phosphate dehydrogenase assembly protein OpcA
MSTTYKVLGQSAPAATTDTTLYTVPSSTNAIVSSLVVANRASSSATYRVAIRPAGATIANQHYIAFDIPLDGNDSTSLTLGLTLAATDVITVRASSASCSFSAFGSEVS